MLTIRIGGTKAFDEETSSFIVQGGTQLRMEHSLISLSKWESIYEKPFLSTDEKSAEELLGYIKCMILDEDVPEEVFGEMTKENFVEINDYINAKMTATWFSDKSNQPKSREVVTAELIYYWLTVYKINWEVQYWHLNRLFTLIQIANLKGGDNKPKKMSRAEMAARRRELNAQRKREFGTNG